MANPGLGLDFVVFLKRQNLCAQEKAVFAN